MDDLVSISYLPQLNQTLIINNTLIRNVTSQRAIESVYKYLESVRSLDGSGVKLGVSFTNTSANLMYLGVKGRFRHLTSMVFPLYAQEVDYGFKKEDFFINFSRDPYVVLGEGGLFCPSTSAVALFFKKNPFENLKCYSRLSSFLPNLTGDKELLPYPSNF